jgi:predicted small metal-binding protein
MFGGKAVRCDCGYEVRAYGEAAVVDAVRRHAWEAHGIDFSVELALDVVRRADVLPTTEHKENRSIGEEKR